MREHALGELVVQSQLYTGPGAGESLLSDCPGKTPRSARGAHSSGLLLGKRFRKAHAIQWHVIVLHLTRAEGGTAGQGWRSRVTLLESTVVFY